MSDEDSGTGELNPRQKRFVEEFIIDLNATQAAIRAGYSESCAASTASTIRRYPNVAAAIKAAQEDAAERVGITQEWVLNRLKIESEREGEDASHAARVSAAGLLAKHKGMLIERHEHTGKDGAPLVKLIQGVDDDAV